MTFLVSIGPKIRGRMEPFSFHFEHKSFHVKGKHLKYATCDGENWFYGIHRPYSKPTDALSALRPVFEMADFPASLPNELITWWLSWKDGTMTQQQIETKLKGVEGLLEKVSSASSVAY
jgi:hypothetical protein